jgi:hypothetical protein
VVHIVTIGLERVNHHSMKMYGRILLHISLTSALDVGEWSASRLGRFASGERALGTHWIRGWVGPRADLDTVEEREDFLILPETEPRPSSSKPSLYRLSYPGSPGTTGVTYIQYITNQNLLTWLVCGLLNEVVIILHYIPVYSRMTRWLVNNAEKYAHGFHGSRD